jgi:hypothetical protein
MLRDVLKGGSRLAVLSVWLALAVSGWAQDAGKPADWRENHAYTLGVQAYVFGYPWVYLSQLQYQWVVAPPKDATSPSMSINQFWHARQIITSDYRDGGSPNNDTLYSVACMHPGNSSSPAR